MNNPQNLLDQISITEALTRSRQAMDVCEKCIVPDGFRGHSLDEDRHCTYCATDTLTGTKREVTDAQRAALRASFDERLSECKAKGGLYDVAVGFSGGKDSTYLIWKLQHEYGLRVLGIVIDHSFFPDIVAKNIAETAQRLSLDTHYCHIDHGLMESFFKHKFRLHAENMNTPLFDMVCGECSDLIEGNVMKVAAGLGIPVVMIGLSPEQTNRYFFQVDRGHVQKRWMSDFFDQDSISNGQRRFQWDPKSDAEKNLEVFIPFHVWDYDATKIAEELEQMGLLTQTASDPLKTECKVLHTIRFIDHQNLGFDPRIGPFSDLVRMGQADRLDMMKKFYDFEFDPGILEEVHERLELYR